MSHGKLAALSGLAAHPVFKRKPISQSPGFLDSSGKKAKADTGKGRKTKVTGSSNRSGTRKTVKVNRGKGRKRKSLKKRVQSLEKRVKKEPVHKFIYKADLGAQQLLSPGKASYKYVYFWDPTTIEAALDGAKYNPMSAPSTTTTINLPTAAANQKIPMDLYTKMFIRNNHNMPVNMTYYVFELKNSMVSLAATAPNYNHIFALDLSKDGITNTSAGDAMNDNPGVFMSDSEKWRKEVRVIESGKLRLEAGDEFEVSSSASIRYNQERNDTEGDAGERDLAKYTRIFLSRLTGVVAHDATTTTNVGWGDGGIDLIRRQKFVVHGISDGLKSNLFEINNATTLTTPQISGVDTVQEQENA